MPWDIKQNFGSCNGYAVVKRGTTEIEGCHSTREAAQRQIAALYAAEPEAAKVKKMMKPGSFSEGDFAMASVDDHVYVGQIVHIMTEGMLGVEGSKKSIVATPENPAILIRVFEQHEDGYWKETYMFTGFDSMSGSLIDPLPMKRDFFINGGTEKSLPEMSREEQKEFVEQMTTAMDKADSVRVGQMVSWNSSGGRAQGRVMRVIRNGKYNVPDSDFTITGTPDDPAVVIRLYRDGDPTDTMVGHKMSTLRVIGKSIDDEIKETLDILDLISKGYKDKEKSIDEDEDDWEKRDYSTEQRREMASNGQAMPDGSFPIANRTDLRNAIQSIGRASNYDAVRQHIVRRARALDATDMLPEDWNMGKSEEYFDFSKLDLADIDLKPTESMASNARRGLELRRQYGRGGTSVGVARARDLSNRKTLSPETVARMYSYFSRHEVDKKGKGWNPGTEGYPSNGRIAWLLWGGDSGYSWAKSKWSQIQRARMSKEQEDAEKKLTEVFLSNVPREARRTGKEYTEVYFRALTEKDK